MKLLVISGGKADDYTAKNGPGLRPLGGDSSEQIPYNLSTIINSSAMINNMTINNSTVSSPNLCPLCGKENLCAVASDPDAKDCWCFHTEISPLARRKVAAIGQSGRCICPQCAALADRLAKPV